MLPPRQLIAVVEVENPRSELCARAHGRAKNKAKITQPLGWRSQSRVGRRSRPRHSMVKETKAHKRAHACSRCDSTFASPSQRDRHVRTVHEKRRDHACPHCAAAFGRAGNLTTHVRTQHPDNTQDNECQQARQRRPRPLLLCDLI